MHPRFVILSCLFISAAVLFSTAQCDDTKTDGTSSSSSGSGTGVRAWIGNVIRGMTTTTTTVKPNIFNRVGNFYDQSKKNIQYVLDPKKAIQTRLMQAVGISG